MFSTPSTIGKGVFRHAGTSPIRTRFCVVRLFVCRLFASRLFASRRQEEVVSYAVAMQTPFVVPALAGIVAVSGSLFPPKGGTTNKESQPIRVVYCRAKRLGKSCYFVFEGPFSLQRRSRRSVLRTPAKAAQKFLRYWLVMKQNRLQR